MPGANPSKSEAMAPVSVEMVPTLIWVAVTPGADEARVVALAGEAAGVAAKADGLDQATRVKTAAAAPTAVAPRRVFELPVRMCMNPPTSVQDASDRYVPASRQAPLHDAAVDRHLGRGCDAGDEGNPNGSRVLCMITVSGFGMWNVLQPVDTPTSQFIARRAAAGGGELVNGVTRYRKRWSDGRQPA